MAYLVLYSTAIVSDCRVSKYWNAVDYTLSKCYDEWAGERLRDGDRAEIICVAVVWCDESESLVLLCSCNAISRVKLPKHTIIALVVDWVDRIVVADVLNFDFDPCFERCVSVSARAKCVRDFGHATCASISHKFQLA